MLKLSTSLCDDSSSYCGSVHRCGVLHSNAPSVTWNSPLICLFASPQRISASVLRTFDTATIETWHRYPTLYRATSHPSLCAQATEPSPQSPRLLPDNATLRRFKLYKAPVHLFDDVAPDLLRFTTLFISRVTKLDRFRETIPQSLGGK